MALKVCSFFFPSAATSPPPPPPSPCLCARFFKNFYVNVDRFFPPKSQFHFFQNAFFSSGTIPLSFPLPSSLTLGKYFPFICFLNSIKIKNFIYIFFNFFFSLEAERSFDWFPELKLAVIIFFK